MIRYNIAFNIIKILLTIALIMRIAGAQGENTKQLHPYVSGEEIMAQVSATRINRIKFGESPFTQVIGDETKYNLVTDERGVNLFLTTKVPAGEKLDLFLINTNGEIADLKLTVADIPSQIIEIIPLSLSSSNYDCDIEEIALMLENMIADRKDKYYVLQDNRIITNVNPRLKVIQDRTYRYNNLIGARLTVKNSDGKNGVNLHETGFAKVFKNIKAISIKEKFISKGKSTYVWIVSKRGK